MPPPSVSVILPTHQRRGLAVTAVESVLAQSVRDLELIVVDDGSEDGTGEALAGRDPRLRYVWQENAGVGVARNRGVELAGAPVVAFLDSDNRWLPDHLEVLLLVLDRHPEAVLATTNPYFALEGDETPEASRLLDLWPNVGGYAGGPGYISGVAIRREALAAVGGFDERLHAGEDTDLFVRLGVIGPIATVQRRTLVRGVTSTSLGESGQHSGDYLRGAELSALSLVALAEARANGELLLHARGRLHLARAMAALERADTAAVAAEIEQAERLLPSLRGSPASLPIRIREHLPSAKRARGRAVAYATVTDVWPDRASEMARFMRTLAVLASLRAGMPAEALRLVRERPRGGNLRFLRRRAVWFRKLAAASRD